MPFISPSCMIAVARTSNAMLNRSDESRHSCLIPDLSGKGFSFCPLSMMLAVGFSYSLFILDSVLENCVFLGMYPFHSDFPI